MLGPSLSVVLLALVLAGVVRAGSGGGKVTAGVLPAPTKHALPGRDASSAVDLAGWRVVGIVVEDAAGDRHILPLAGPVETPASTSTPTPTQTPRATDAPSMTPTETPMPTDTPSAPPTDSPTPTPEDTCVVRSTANVWARTLPVVRSDTGIGILPADSPVRITGYTVEQVDAHTSYIWYRYWYDVEHPEAWSRADFFTERDESPGCRLLPRVTEP